MRMHIIRMGFQKIPPEVSEQIPEQIMEITPSLSLPFGVAYKGPRRDTGAQVQARYANALNNKIAYQRNISAFTVVTVIFLPVGFFAQVYLS